MQKKFLYYFLCLDLPIVAGLLCMGVGSDEDTLASKIVYVFVLLLMSAIPSVFIAAIFVAIHNIVTFNDQNPPQISQKILPHSKSTTVRRHTLRLILTEEEEENIKGDLEEEFNEVAAKFGAWYAKFWYYWQVARSAWPMMRKAAGWGLLASIGAWLRRII